MSLSSVAGIIDSNGGLRVVVTQRWRMGQHLRKGERLFVLPGLKVQEPVAWGDGIVLLERARAYVLSQVAPENHCGGCTVCCRVPSLKTQAFTKPSHQMCGNCRGNKCEIYWNRPLQCATFECLWLKSQKTDKPMAPDLRPDRAKVMLTGREQPDEPEDMIYVHPDRRVARGVTSCEMTEPMREWIEASGRPAMVVTHYHGEDGK